MQRRCVPHLYPRTLLSSPMPTQDLVGISDKSHLLLCALQLFEKGNKKLCQERRKGQKKKASSNASTQFIPVTLHQTKDASWLQKERCSSILRYEDFSVFLILVNWWHCSGKQDRSHQVLYIWLPIFWLPSSKTDTSFSWGKKKKKKAPKNQSTVCQTDNQDQQPLLQTLQC